jgi:hypothetical protein
MSISQEEVPVPGSLTYWSLILPAALLPVFDIRSIVEVLVGRARILVLMLILGGGWHLVMGDERASLQLALLVLVLAWAGSDAARLRVSDLLWLYVALVLVGIVLFIVSDLNKWGPLPGLTVAEYGIWRVSFFPNIAYTAFLSLAVVFLLTKDMETARRFRAVLAIALFYVIFSFVRTALIALVLYGLLRWMYSRALRPGQLFWSSLASAVLINVAIAGSVAVIDALQHIPLISRLFLRGETNLDEQEIFVQLYRPWVWWQHLQLFASSPWLMGWGVFDFNELKTEELVDAIDWSDTVSFPTRLLAAYGLAGSLFIVFLVQRLRASAASRDAWACACFPPVVLLMMQWGSVFHPSDALFVFFMMMIVSGSRAFVDAPPASAAPSVRRKTRPT